MVVGVAVEHDAQSADQPLQHLFAQLQPLHSVVLPFRPFALRETLLRATRHGLEFVVIVVKRLVDRRGRGARQLTQFALLQDGAIGGGRAGVPGGW